MSTPPPCSGCPGEGGCFLHNPHYDFNDEVLPIGASFFARLAERFLAGQE
jgi:hippurate hydrolase